MVKLIVGKKGSGKTKILIDGVNTAARESKGNVVCIEKGAKLTYDLSHDVKLIDIDAYYITNFNEFFGFICGCCASNYDITDIYVDGTLKICGSDLKELDGFVAKAEKFSAAHNVTLILSVSADASELSEGLAKFIA